MADVKTLLPVTHRRRGLRKKTLKDSGANWTHTWTLHLKIKAHFLLGCALIFNTLLPCGHLILVCEGLWNSFSVVYSILVNEISQWDRFLLAHQEQLKHFDRTGQSNRNKANQLFGIMGRLNDFLKYLHLINIFSFFCEYGHVTKVHSLSSENLLSWNVYFKDQMNCYNFNICFKMKTRTHHYKNVFLWISTFILSPLRV